MNLTVLQLLSRQKLATATRISTFCETITNETCIESLETRLEKLDNIWTEFIKIVDQMYQFADDPAYSDPDSEVQAFEDNYFTTKAILLKEISSRKNADTSVDDTVNRLAQQQQSFIDRLSSTSRINSFKESLSDTKLPKINISPFSGNYNEWMSFHDLFTATIHTNNQLKNSQKFHYLKGFLTDEAASLLRHIPISDANYNTDWEKLKQRYHKRGQIVSSFIKTFFSMSPITNITASSLRKLTDGADEVIRGLDALGEDAKSRDPWLNHLLLNKLDATTRQSWAEEITGEDFPSFKKLLLFLEKKCQALESLQSSLKTSSVSKGFKSNHVYVNNTKTSGIECCPKCKSNHHLFNCNRFHSMDIPSRRKFVHDQRLCYNCLRIGHHSSTCNSKHTCQKCHRRHHTLVHPIIENSKSSSNPVTNPPNNALINSHAYPSNSNQFASLLPTVLAEVRDAFGLVQSVRILLDSGSQVSFISESLVKRLHLQRKHARLPITGLSSVRSGTTKGMVQVTLISRLNSRCLELNAFILQTLTSPLPVSEFNCDQLSDVLQISLADPTFNKPGTIDILIGADKMFHILEEQKFDIQHTPLVAQNTIFGWIIAGILPHGNQHKVLSCVATTSESLIDIDKTLQRFWEVEQGWQHTNDSLSEEEQQAETHYTSTTVRASDGRYIVQLPFKNSSIVLGSSYAQSLRSLSLLENRFMKSKSLHESYKNFMNEYKELNHMELVPECEVDKERDIYFLPHHAVLKPDSSTTKLRVVFNGSCKTTSGHSLNDALLTGPIIQRELFYVSLRFRQHPFVFSCDIQKMYRQILMAEKHCDFQRILWRDSINQPISQYRLTTVTYGTSPAPFLAVRTLKQLATDYQSVFPTATQVLLKDCYVDDIMTGMKSVDELISLKSELVMLLQQGGFKLHKWSSNCWPLLMSCPEKECELSSVEFDEDSKSIKTLGMHWYAHADVFVFKFSSPDTTLLTKRILLSEASQIYDPLGLLTPITVAVKILYQSLWFIGLSWDTPVPKPVKDKWTKIKSELSLISTKHFERWIGNITFNTEFHGFCDASEKAYAAVIYCRSVINGSVEVRLVAAKSKVAPIKQISVPRLELCAAILLSRLMKHVITTLECNSPVTYYWTDSKIVLSWLSDLPRRWTTFVANRTSEILDLSSRRDWHHVPSNDNPADPASRGLSPAEFVSNTLWFHGHEWLKLNNSNWPNNSINLSANQTYPEERKFTVQSFLISQQDDMWSTLFNRVSSWITLLRIVAYCYRFSHNSCCRIKTSADVFIGTLTYQEIAKAKIAVLKAVQASSFYAEIQMIQSMKPLPRSSKLSILAPFLDKDGLLRITGRLQNSDLPYNSKHPVVLPKHHSISYLIVKYFHLKYLHCGPSLLLSTLRNEFWIFGVKAIVKRTIHDCLPCFRQNKATMSQIMSSLPTPRVTFSSPFTHVGCDYAAPITLRLARGRKPTFVKGYIALFVCFSSKAVHIELVGSLTSEAFIAALRRFIARRGKCSVIYTDNATNFKGAHRKLSELHQLIQSDTYNTTVRDLLSNDEIRWDYIPPASPHFGGLWEAGVKSVKSHLKRVVGNNVLTYEEINTVLTQIEAVLNSRPLCALPNSDFEALTPFHLLTGHSYTPIPDQLIDENKTSQLSNWELLQNMLQGFWKRWRLDYLTTLQQRPKRRTPEDQLKVDDVVVIKDSNLPPAKWSLARVIALHPGKDGHVRVVTLKTQMGEFVQPVVKLAKLPVQ